MTSSPGDPPCKARIVFMGTPRFAVPSLEALCNSGDQIVTVVTRPDKPKGRGRAVTPCPVKEAALELGLGVMEPAKLGAPETVTGLKGLKPDMIVVVAFGRFLPRDLLQLPPMGCVNVHASLLPSYRGAAPIQWAILKGERETGVTTMFMDEGMDTGDILLQRAVPIGPGETCIELTERLSFLAADLLLETVARLKRGDIVARPQLHEQATIAPTLKKEDGRIDWGLPAEQIERMVRALNPWPGSYTHIGETMVRITGSRVTEGPGDLPGRVLSLSADGMVVACGTGALIVTELQPENRRVMTPLEFSLGHPMKVGALLGSSRGC